MNFSLRSETTSSGKSGSPSGRSAAMASSSFLRLLPCGRRRGRCPFRRPLDDLFHVFGDAVFLHDVRLRIGDEHGDAEGSIFLHEGDVALLHARVTVVHIEDDVHIAGSVLRRAHHDAREGVALAVDARSIHKDDLPPLAVEDAEDAVARGLRLGETMATFSPTSTFISVLLPAFALPMTATVPLLILKVPSFA